MYMQSQYAYMYTLWSIVHSFALTCLVISLFPLFPPVYFPVPAGRKEEDVDPYAGSTDEASDMETDVVGMSAYYIYYVSNIKF